MRKKVFFLLLVVLFVVSSSATSLFADDEEKVSPSSGLRKDDTSDKSVGIVDSIFDNPLLRPFGELTIKDSIEYRGEEYSLYPVFDDKEASLAVFYRDYGSIIDRVSEQRLAPLTNENWRTYAALIEDALAKESSPELRNDLNIMQQFVDVFSGYWYNDRVHSFVNENSDKAETDEYFNYLACLMPYNSPLYQQYKNSKLRELETVNRSWSVNLAKLYALDYAEDANDAFIYISGGDCANFASQIRNAGGKDMTWAWHYWGPGSLLRTGT